MKIISTKDKDFKEKFRQIEKRSIDLEKIEKDVRQIIDRVKREGDKALLEFTKKFDKVELDLSQLEVKKDELQSAYRDLSKEEMDSITLAYQRIKEFHHKQSEKSWFVTEKEGEFLAQKLVPIERVGVYVPGGRTIYPSCVLMNVVPAKVAGVKEVIVVTPPSSEGIASSVLTAMYLCGVDRVFKVGGAHAIAALAYGTNTIPKVDKIVGPGNIFVTCAKKLLYGEVDIDMLAGPSEVVVIADEKAPCSFIASDLLAQAEHDPMAMSVLITYKEDIVKEVEKELDTQIKDLVFPDEIKNQIVIILCRDLDEAFELSNRIAPEHLELVIDDPMKWIYKVENAGAVFLGPYSPVTIGDYLAGPNHVLPTAGTARFFSCLNVGDFQKRISIISFTKETLSRLAESTIRLARMESLEAHARSVEKRLKSY